MLDESTTINQIANMGKNLPRHLAISTSTEILTYEDLDLRATQFARYLLSQGLPSGACVPLCLERSPDWVVAALGIMRAGAAYVPLDEAWPSLRLKHAIADTQSKFLVARDSVALQLQSTLRVIDPRRDAAAIAAAPPISTPQISPESLAYVIFTSGSTGAPKGVEITHANLSHLIRWHSEAFSIRQEDRVSHLAGLGFDAAVWELWPNLCAGATVVMADEETRLSAPLIQQWLLREEVTVCYVPTVHAGPIMRLDWPAKPPLRLLLTGGEALLHFPPPHLPFAVVNNYGPSECTVVATSTTLYPGGEGKPPIGRPIAGAFVYLIDQSGDLVQDPAIGEIYIGGAGVGRQYRSLPEATLSSFVADPFVQDPKARMYRTGDLGRRLADGQIEFCGRVDRQIKIRGQRVELDEIDAVLSQHPKVSFATSMFLAQNEADPTLIAYVLVDEEHRDLTVTALQNHLRQSLPSYMIPAAFVRLKEIPITAAGKIDRSKLPLPIEGNLWTSSEAAAPTGIVEERLLTMVRELLKNKQVTTEDNFFLSGGHSLLGMQLAIGLQKAFGVDLALRQILSASNVKILAAAIETKMVEDVASIQEENVKAYLDL